MGRGSSGRSSRSQRVSTPRQIETPESERQGERQDRTPERLYDFFRTASDEDADKMLDEWRQERMDEDGRSNNNDIQRFFHYVGWTENTPVTLSEEQYQAAYRAAGSPEQIYHADYDASNATAQEFADQYFGQARNKDGKAYRQYVSNGIFGGGTYFANRAGESAAYGTNQFRGFLNHSAKPVEFTALHKQFSQAPASLKRVIYKMTSGYGGDSEKLSIFAAMKGYNVITLKGTGYYVVLDRRATTVSTRTRKDLSYRMDNW